MQWNFLRDALNHSSQDLSKSYLDRKQEVAGAYEVLREWAAAALNGPLQEHVNAMPNSSFEDKRNMALFINDQCRTFGLAVKSKSTGSASRLGTAKPSVRGDGYRRNGYFYFESLGPNQQPRQYDCSVELPSIQLMPDSEKRAHWRERLKQERQVNLETGTKNNLTF